MISDDEYRTKIRGIADDIRARTKGTATEKQLAVIEGLLELSLSGLNEINKRVTKLEEKSKHNV